MATLKTNYTVRSKYEAFYTGGRIQVSEDGVYMFCGCGNKINILEISTGKVHSTIGEAEEEEITSFCLTPDNKYLVLATQHLLLRQWDWQAKSLVRTWKAIHTAPVVCMTFDPTSTLLATGSADSTIKVWDIEKQYCTHNFRGHQGIISVAAFHGLQLYSAGEDYKVRVWDLSTSRCLTEVGAHYSIVTSIIFSADGSQAFSSGRDGVVVVWDCSKHAVARTIPVFEAVESLILVPEGQPFPHINVDGKCQHFVTAGNKGILRVWNSATSQCVYSTESVNVKCKEEEKEGSQNIVQTLYNSQQKMVTVVTYDHNISRLGLEKLQLQKQFAGNNDEIVDVKYFGPDERYAVVATNSMHLKVFELETWDCEILYGHTDIVVSIDVFSNSDMFISSGKDNSVRLWQLNPSKKQVSCLAIGQGHTHAVGAVAFSRLKPKFFVSGSEDCTLKLWNIPTDLDPSVTKEIHAAVTEKAHDKDISSVVVSPNDKFIASGSMDKTAKLWSASDLTLLGVFRGHRRGIWCVQFSPIDQVVATSSGDGTIKLWSLTDFSCVKTFEGHDCAILKVTFISRGMQLLSSGTSGLVKLWTIKSNECVRTLDGHEDKVWALVANQEGDRFISGAADSSLVIWEDVTETEQDEKRQKQEEQILQEQELSNLIQNKKYLKAIGLAITLEQPFKVLTIMKEILAGDTGQDKLHETLGKLRMDQIDALLRFSSQWNTNSRHCHEAQFVLSSLLKMYPPSQLQRLDSVRSAVEAFIPYTERHCSRLNKLMQQSMFLEYSWQCMKSLTPQDGSQLSAITGADSATLGLVIDTVGSKSISDDDSSSSESDEENLETNNMSEAKSLQSSKTTTPPEAVQEKSDQSSSEEEMMELVPSHTADSLVAMDTGDYSSSSESEDEDQQPKKTPRLDLYGTYCARKKVKQTIPTDEIKLDSKKKQAVLKRKKVLQEKKQVVEEQSVPHKKQGEVPKQAKILQKDKLKKIKKVGRR